MTLKVVTAPVYEPVKVSEFESWARISSADSQAGLATLLIQAMREYAENLTGRAFIPRSLQLILPGWQCGWIELPQPPLLEVTSITYVDLDGVQQTLAADQYVVHSDREPGVVVPAWQVAWPAVRNVIDAVRVNYRAGYAAIGSPEDESAFQAAIPAKLKLWLHARAATFHENREQIILSNRVKIPHDFADGLLDSLVIGSRLF